MSNLHTFSSVCIKLFLRPIKSTNMRITTFVVPAVSITPPPPSLKKNLIIITVVDLSKTCEKTEFNNWLIVR